MFISRPARAPLILAMSSESSGCSFSSTIGTRAIWFLFKIRVLEVTYPKERQSDQDRRELGQNRHAGAAHIDKLRRQQQTTHLRPQDSRLRRQWKPSIHHRLQRHDTLQLEREEPTRRDYWAEC